jgi:hypothetical protein
MKRHLGIVVVVLGMLCSSVQAGRFAEYTAKYKNPPNPIKGVVAAGWIGSEGAEWCSAGDILPDGTVVVAGTALGPTMNQFCGVQVKVLGSDAGSGPGAQEQKDARGQPVYPDWKRKDGAGFVAAIAPDAKSCRWVVRFPWKSGSITDLIADSSGIYVVGKAGDAISSIGSIKNVSSEPVNAQTGSVFVVKLALDGSKVLWGVTFADPDRGPKLRFVGDGRVIAEGGWVYVLKPDGGLDKVVQLNKKYKGCRGVNPVTFQSAFGWDSNTHTGREPWRQPHLRITAGPEPDAPSKTYYAWDSKLVGTDKYRLVSDSSIRLLHYVNGKTLYAIGWSDGGNTVFEREPGNLDQAVKFQGLGFSTWGANVGSFCHILKFDVSEAEPKVIGKTLWASYLKGKDKPNSSSVTSIEEASDKSTLIAGGAAHHVIQTGNHIFSSSDEVAGQYIAVLTGDASSIRFSSAIDCAGVVAIRENATWGLASRKVGEKHLALFVGSAIEKRAVAEPPIYASQKNPIQKSYGGGLTDGYLVLLEL